MRGKNVDVEFLYFYLTMEGINIPPFLDDRLLLLGEINRHGAK